MGEECLEELVKRNLVLVIERKWDGSIKSCSLHDLMLDLCIRRAYESEFFLNLMDCHIGSASSIASTRKNLRRVSFDSYISYLSYELCRLMLYGSTIHSIKFSRYYLVGLHFLKSVRLLRVLDAESADVDCSGLRDEVYDLFHLRYFDIRCSRRIPFSMLLTYCHRNMIVIEVLSESALCRDHTIAHAIQTLYKKTKVSIVAYLVAAVESDRELFLSARILA